MADLPKSGQFKLAQDVYNRTPAERYQDERKVAAIARNRDKVIGALFNKLVKPVMEDIRLTEKKRPPKTCAMVAARQSPLCMNFRSRTNAIQRCWVRSWWTITPPRTIP